MMKSQNILKILAGKFIKMIIDNWQKGGCSTLFCLNVGSCCSCKIWGGVIIFCCSIEQMNLGLLYHLFAATKSFWQHGKLDIRKNKRKRATLNSGKLNHIHLHLS